MSAEIIKDMKCPLCGSKTLYEQKHKIIYCTYINCKLNLYIGEILHGKNYTYFLILTTINTLFLLL